MNDRDCESCKKFSRTDPIESEGYCEAKRTWVDPQEGEDCKMHEFTLHSATKYKDGTPIMSEPEKTAEQSNQLDTNYCKLGTCSHYDKFCDHTLQDKHMCPYLPHDTDSNLKYLEQAFTDFAKTQDELIEEYDATLKTHGNTLEQHMEHIKDMDAVLATHAGKINSHADILEDHKERITINEGNIDAISSDIEDLQRKVYAIYKYFNAISPNVFFDICKGIEELAHKGSDFCGNCTHAKSEDGIYACELTGEIIDPDDSSCSMFEPSYSQNPEWFDNMKKAMITPSEPSVGCVDCKYAIHGMCEKYNCSLGTICATPECHESFPF